MATGVADDEEGFDDATMRMLSDNLPENIFRCPDPRIQMAALESERTKRLMPVLKEELRLRILTKRMERGEPELETNHIPKTYELTEEEMEKRERRKEQNRVAARKCREKRKMKNLDLAEKFDNARDENDALKNRIDELEKTTRLMEKFFTEHMRNGCCQMIGLPTSTTVASHFQCSSSSISNSSNCNNNNNNNKVSTDGCNDSSNNNNNNNNNIINISSSSTDDNNSSSSSSNNNSSSKSSSNTITMSSPAVITIPSSSPHALPISPLTPLSPSSPNLSLPPPSPSSISPELFSPHYGAHTPMDVCGQSTIWLTRLTSGVQTPVMRSSSPKFSGVTGTGPSSNNSSTSSSRPHVSRASSTASLPPPPPSPCHPNQSSSLVTLTPPPSVSSEFNIVPESPSYFTNMSGLEPNEFSARLTSDHLMADMNLSCYTAQLTPDESPISNSSGTNINMIIHQDKMFDDDDDDDDYENDRNEISAMVPWDKLQ